MGLEVVHPIGDLEAKGQYERNGYFWEEKYVSINRLKRGDMKLLKIISQAGSENMKYNLLSHRIRIFT